MNEENLHKDIVTVGGNAIARKLIKLGINSEQFKNPDMWQCDEFKRGLPNQYNATMRYTGFSPISMVEDAPEASEFIVLVTGDTPIIVSAASCPTVTVDIRIYYRGLESEITIQPKTENQTIKEPVGMILTKADAIRLGLNSFYRVALQTYLTLRELFGWR